MYLKSIVKFSIPSPISQLPASNKGFTILEILVVFTLIAILSGIGFASFVTYSRSQQVNQTANDIKLMIGQARFNALSAVKTNRGADGNVEDCGSETLGGYSIVKIGTDRIELNQICLNTPDTLIKTIQLPNNIGFTIASTCTTIMFDSLTSRVNGAPCTIVVGGYSESKTITVDAIGNVSVN